MAKAKTSITTENRSGSAADAAAKEQRTEMPLSDLHPFEGHPFKVLDDELMEQTVESIRQIGVVSPLIVDSNIKRIRLYIGFICKYDEEINSILESMHELAAANEDTDFVKQIRLIETFKGAGFLSAMSLMGEIGDFSAFSKPKQLFAYFGLDPAVKQSGKFEGTKIQMSKRGSAIARRVIHTPCKVSVLPYR